MHLYDQFVASYSPSEVLSGTPPAMPDKFVTAIWDYPSLEQTEIVVSFGTDCSAIPAQEVWA
jgi:hypothetical protein